MALAPETDQIGNQLGRVLQVAIHDDDRSPSGMFEASAYRRLLPEIPAQADHDRLFVLAVQGVEQVGRRVPAAIVDEDYLEVRARLIRGAD